MKVTTKLRVTLLLSTVAVVGLTSWAALAVLNRPDVKVLQTVKHLREGKVIEASSEALTKTVLQGDELVYELTVSNSGDQSASNLKLYGNILPAMEYLDAEPAALFSTETGEPSKLQFDPEPMVTKLINGKATRTRAPATAVKSLRFTVEKLNPQESKTFTYRVRLRK